MRCALRAVCPSMNSKKYRYIGFPSPQFTQIADERGSALREKNKIQYRTVNTNTH